MKRNDIKNVLLKIGIPTGNNGFKYITDAILILSENPDISITKELYPMIAKQNSTTGSRVERSIRYAFEIARSPKGNYDAVEHYIGFINCQNHNSLKMLCMRIEQECKSVEKQIELTPREDSEEDKIRRIVREELKAVMGGIA